MSRWGLRAVVWLVVAAVVTWPAAAHLSTRLIGHPDVDVWNHAWGWWWFATSLAEGQLPYQTDLLGWPGGGELYFIDPLGALAGLPLTWLAGPIVSFNVVLMARVAATGAFAQLLAEELAQPSRRVGARSRALGGWLAGVGAATAPYLLCELHNAITEACSLHLVALSLWAFARAMRLGRWRDWVGAGLALGLTAIGSFYFGLGVGLAVMGLVLVRMARPLPDAPIDRSGLLLRAAAAAGLSLLVAAPAIAAFHSSLVSATGLIDRNLDPSEAMRLHNAVDPQSFFRPGAFMSVDFAAFGERFRHTGYLRLSILPLALLAALRLPRARPWLGLLAGCLVLGLGERLFFDGGFVDWGGRQWTLPFGWLQGVLPALAITHPLRLTAVSQVLAPVLAGVAIATMGHRWARAAPVVALVAAAETAWCSAAAWPLPTAAAQVPAYAATLPQGPILDLPTELGNTMRSSRHLWYQTAHGQPMPFRPDVRLERTSHTELIRVLSRRGQPKVTEGIDQLWNKHAKLLRQNYAAIVVHTDLEQDAGLPVPYEDILSPHFGPPERHGDQLIWRLR